MLTLNFTSIITLLPLPYVPSQRLRKGLIHSTSAIANNGAERKNYDNYGYQFSSKLVWDVPKDRMCAQHARTM